MTKEERHLVFTWLNQVQTEVQDGEYNEAIDTVERIKNYI